MECGTQGPVGNIRTYRTRAIITHGLYTFYPHFEVRLCTVTFGLKYGLYSRAASNQERPMMARVRYLGILSVENIYMYSQNQPAFKHDDSKL